MRIFQSMSLVSVLVLLALTGITYAQQSHVTDEDRILVWIAPGSQPGSQGASQPGQIGFVGAQGDFTPLFDVPLGTARVYACGNQALAPDANLLALYLGASDAGNLVMVRYPDMQTTVLTQDLSALSCTGNGMFQYAPDGGRFGYLAYPAQYGLRDSPAGRLFVHNSADLSLTRQFDNISAFDLSNDITAMVSFFTNSQQQASEVGFIVDDGVIDREVATLFADDRCFYTSASVDIMADGKLASVLGYRCTVGDGRTRWQFYLVDPQTFSATLIASDVANGAFFSGARTNNVLGAPDSDVIFFTVPDGITTYTTGLRALDVPTGESRIIFDNSAILPREAYVPYQRTNHPTEFSGDGNYMAIVRSDPNNRTSLTVLDLAQYDLPPIEVTMPNRNMFIGDMLFTPDNQRLIYTVGSDDNAFNSSLFALDLVTGSEQRIRRGNYGQGVLSPDGRFIAITNWFIINVDAPPIYGMVTLDLTTTEELPLFIGADIVDGDLVNQRFIYPLAWWR